MGVHIISISKSKVNVKVLEKIRGQFDSSQIFLMVDLIDKLSKEKPYQGLNVFYNAHLTLSSLLQIEALVVSGANVTVTCSPGLKCDPQVAAILNEANLPITDYNSIGHANCDIGLDCCGGLLAIASSKYGMIELTQTGVNKYNQYKPNYPVISIDDTEVKLLETLLGTGDGFVRGFHRLANTGLLGKNFVVVGYGKVGQGVVKSLLPFTKNITIIDRDIRNINNVHSTTAVYDINDTSNVVKALQEAFCIVTATGEQHIMSKYFERDMIGAKYLANMGSEDEWGDKFTADEVLYNKMPINFCLDYPTQLLFLDPIFYSQIVAIDELLNNSLQPGICHVPSAKIQLNIIMRWLLRHYQSAHADDHLENILYNLPAFVYWKDLDSVYSGCNMNFAKAAGLDSPQKIVGKTDHELPWRTTETDLYRSGDKEAFKGNSLINFEETQLQADGTHKTVLASKIPLRNQDKQIVGVLGIYADISDRKEKERLEIVNQAHSIHAKEQEKFVKVVGQMAHDIRSPLSTLKTIVQTADELAEQKRVTLRRAVINIEDITNHMLNRYKPKESKLTQNNQRQYVLVSVILAEIASERRYRYQNSAIQFDLVITTPQVNNFLFIQIEPSNLRRMLSNLINNAAEALPKTGGKIILELSSGNEWVEISVIDNGIGISLEKLQQIRQKIGVKTSKKSGFGIGLTQVFDVLETNYGEFDISSSTVGDHHGTTVSIKFPKAKIPNWIATEINLTPDDVIVVVDDDMSIHGAWDSRIAYILEKFPSIEVKHFMSGREALEFIDVLKCENDNVCLLSDYELLNQDIDGLEIIRQSGVKRSLLVTSHYTDCQVRKSAAKMGVKVLPKELVCSIPLKIKRPKYKSGQLVNVHMIFVDDESEVVEGIIADHYSHLITDYYSTPFELLKEIDKYPKDVKIIMDNNYSSGGEICPISGYALAEKLHAAGYTNLYLYSWETCQVPDYVTFILKTDKEVMARLDQL